MCFNWKVFSFILIYQNNNFSLHLPYKNSLNLNENQNESLYFLCNLYNLVEVY